MSEAKNHVLLVSEQAMPNFMPILNPELKPVSVTLVVSDRMKPNAEWLKQQIHAQQVEVLDDIPIGDNASDVNAIQNVLTDWAVGHEELLEKSTLNVTGGTKPMAIAAQEVFRQFGRPVFYLDIQSDTVSWIGDVKHLPKPIHLEKQPTLKQYFGLLGIEILEGDFKSRLENEKWRTFYEDVVRAIQNYGPALGGLNHLASEAEKSRKLDFSPSESEYKLPKWNDMQELLIEHGLVRTHNGVQKKFVSEAARRFCNGIWLEHYVFSSLKELGIKKDCALMNVRVHRVDGTGDNEFDAVVLHRNTCYVIECKTRNMQTSKKSVYVDVADNAVYKVAELSRKLGLRAQGILVSAREVRKEDKDRARNYGVRVFSDLTKLRQDFERIFN